MSIQYSKSKTQKPDELAVGRGQWPSLSATHGPAVPLKICTASTARPSQTAGPSKSVIHGRAAGRGQDLHFRNVTATAAAKWPSGRCQPSDGLAPALVFTGKKN
jgi:hypothetical protein